MLTMPKTSRKQIALTAAIAVLLSACNAPEDATYADAETAFEAGDMLLANERLVALVASGQDDTRTRLLQARVMLRLGDGNRAMLAIEQLPEGSLDPAELRSMTAHAQILQGYAHRVVSDYETLPLAEYTEDDFGMELWAMRDLDEDDDFRDRIGRAIERFPDSVSLNTMAALQLVESGQPYEAMPFAQKAYDREPQNLDTLMLVGQIAIRKGDLEEALGYYKLANQHHPHHALPLANIAGLQLDLDDLDAAGETLDRALQDHPDFPFLNFQSARYQLQQGNIDEARLALEKARKDFAQNTEFILLEAEIEESAGNAVLAIDGYRLFLDRFGYHHEIEERIARLEGEGEGDRSGL